MQKATVVDDFFGLCRRIRRGVVLVFNMKRTVAPDNGGGWSKGKIRKCSKESVRQKVFEKNRTGKGKNLRMEEDVGRRRGCAVVGERELLLGGRTVVGTDNIRTYFEFTSFPPWLAAFLAIARLDWLDIVGGGN